MESKVIRALRKLGVIFSAVNVTVKVGSKDASTDGNEIRIPYPDARTDFEMLTALLMHEASHCRYTDFRAARRSNKLVHSFTNAIEDARIEALIEQVYCGASFMFRDLYQKLLPDIISELESHHPVLLFGLWLNCRASVYFGKPYFQAYEEAIGKYLRTIYPPEMLTRVAELSDKRLPGLQSTSDVVDLSKEIFDIFAPSLKSMQQNQSVEPDADSQGEEDDEEIPQEKERPDEASDEDSKLPDSRELEASCKSESDEDSSAEEEGAAEAPQDASQNESFDFSENSDTSESALGAPDSQAAPLTDKERKLLLRELEANGLVFPEGSLIEAKALLNDFRDQNEPETGLVQISQAKGPKSNFEPLQPGSLGAKRMMKAQKCAVKIRKALRGLIEAKSRGYSYYSGSGLRTDRRRLSRLAVWDTRVFRKKDIVKGEDCALMLLADTSGSMNRPWVEEEYAACLAIAFALQNEPNVDVGFTVFSSEARQIFPLGSKSLLSHQDQIGAPFKQDSTRTDLALMAAFHELAFSRRSRRIVLVMTDGLSDHTYLTQAAIGVLNRNHCEVYALGIGCEVAEAPLYRGCLSIPDIESLATALSDFAKLSLHLGKKAA